MGHLRNQRTRYGLNTLRILLTALLAQSVAPKLLVFGPHTAKRYQFPYQVSIQMKEEHLCGGSLISDKYVITSANCTRQLKVNETVIIAGTHKLSKPGVRLEVAKIIMHPRYAFRLWQHDLALVLLKKPVEFSKKVKPIALTKTVIQYPIGVYATISAYGIINGQLKRPNRLKYANVQLWGHCISRKSYTNDVVCSGHPANEKTPCEGDRGGPLTVDDELYGVVSYGQPCGSKGHATISTYVGDFRPWIRRIAGV